VERSSRPARRVDHVDRLQQQAVAALGDGVDVAGAPGVVAEGPAQLGDGGRKGGVADELLRPHRVDDLLSGHRLAGVRGQEDQQVHGPGLELELPGRTGDAAEGGLHEPLPEPEVPVPLMLGWHEVIVSQAG